MQKLLLADAGVFNRFLESQSLIVIIVIMIVAWFFMQVMKRRNDALAADTLKALRGDSIQQDLFEALLVAAIVWFLYPVSPFKSPLDTTVPATSTTPTAAAAAQPAASGTAAATPAATTATAAGTLVMKDFPPALLPVWKGDSVTFATAIPDASLGIGQFWVVAFKPSGNEAESWMKGYKVKPDRAGVYTLPSGVTDVRVYADTEGIGVRTYPETLTKQ